ncbi:MAG: rod shape-determining protein MreD [Clostridiales bacterium]|uniref:Rod shape-determining protein MreD n=1 Tax=Candidatus Pullilachnospira stercoravium TaxID=2840913 RepID=A0A9D1NTD9_9FIRM|nr:rod shape-determining protein MreD [Clostridiales bacterium]HIV11720.1 rod shape-determining protein MreD [Candidatus Pullilachnospira stercoravium]
MRRKITLAVLILAVFILQGTIFQTLSIASISPNLLLILTVSFGFMRGKQEGLFVGFFCGLLIDIFYGYENVVGFYALLYMYIGFFNGFLYKVFYDEDIKVPMLLVGVSDLAYGLVVYGIQFLLRGRLDVFVYLYRIIIPEMVYTVLITVIFYRILFWLNRKLTETEWEGPRLP